MCLWDTFPTKPCPRYTMWYLSLTISLFTALVLAPKYMVVLNRVAT